MEHEPSVLEELQSLLQSPFQEVPRRLFFIIFGNSRGRFREVSQSVQRSLHRSISQTSYTGNFSKFVSLTMFYRVSHLHVHLRWVDFDLDGPPAEQPLLPNSLQPRKNWAGSGTLKIK